MAQKSSDIPELSIHLVNVFTHGDSGGNLVPIIFNADAKCLADREMRDMARKYNRESAFVMEVPADDESDGTQFRLRFFVPEHEMEICGHATVGTAWVMHNRRIKKHERDVKCETRFRTNSGVVRAGCMGEEGESTVILVSQPKGTVQAISDAVLINDILSTLRIERNQLVPGWPIQNACTSRVKTVIPLKDADALNNLQPDFSKVKELCEKLESTGLYPYAIAGYQNESDSGSLKVEARHFPKASGYTEDAATGIAAAALAWALEANGAVSVGQDIVVYQGRARGYLSQITVKLEEDECWVGGTCEWERRSI